MKELASLLESMCQGTATFADRDRLENLLRDPANRAEYLAATRLHSELLWRWHRGRGDVVRASRGHHASGHQASGHAARSAAATSALTGVRRRFAAAVATARDAAVSGLRFMARPAPLACLVAASVLGAFLVAAGVLSIGPSGDPTFAAAARQVRPIVARVTGLHAVRWPSRQDAWRDWDALPKGSRIDVAAGLVQVTHLDGANVVIEGPASYQVLSGKSGRLIRGRLAARTEHDEPTDSDDRPALAVSDGTPLFTVVAPKRLVHDLGTEFGVEVQESGDTGVHVFEGLVELAAVDRAIAKTEVPVRLGAGESAGIDEAGNVSSGGVAMARRIVRALPKPKPHPQAAEWSDAIAEVIYRDDFSGAGPLHGTTPATRQGVGTVAWSVTPQSWGEMQTKDDSPRLAIAGGGVATLPFVPEPGHLYRLSVVVDVTAGDHNWAAAGFIDPSAPFTEEDPFNYAWFAQRQKKTGNAPPYDFNMHAAGPGRTPRLRGDPFMGEQRRAIILDTSTPRWNVQFLVGGRMVGRHAYAANPSGIQRLGIGSHGGTTTATFRSFVLERNVVRPRSDKSVAAAEQKENEP